MVAYLEKSTGSAGFHQIIDFINRSHICYALTKKPEVCVSFIKQFWRTAEIVTDENGNVKIHATVDGHSLSITEGSIRRHLKLDDQDGLISLPTSEIFAQLALMGYATDSDKLTFQKGAFSPQWRIGVLEADLTKTRNIQFCLTLKTYFKSGEDDSSKQGRKFSNEGVQDDEGVHEKASTETELFIQEVTPTEVIHEQEGSGKASDEISTAGKKKGHASEEGSTEIGKTMGEEKKKAMDEAKTTKEIDWNDPSVLRYHSLKMKPRSIAQARRNMIKYLKNQGNFKINDFKGMSYNEIRPIFEKLWDFNQKFVPMDAEKERTKSPEKERSKSPEKERTTEKIVEEEAGTQEERKEAVNEPAAKRKKSIPRKTTRKRQKLEVETEKEELKTFLDIVPREEAPIDIESLSTKFPIVDWKTIVLTETYMYYQVFRGDGSSKNYKVLSEMLEDFDRMDVEQLFRLVKERYSTTAPEGYDLMLWGDLHTLFEHDENDEIWRDQHEYKLLSWRLCDFCGIHI
ncbi:hypothetical protein Tco_0565561 [Tanacetum coccineum]